MTSTVKPSVRFTELFFPTQLNLDALETPLLPRVSLEGKMCLVQPNMHHSGLPGIKFLSLEHEEKTSVFYFISLW